MAQPSTVRVSAAGPAGEDPVLKSLGAGITIEIANTRAAEEKQVENTAARARLPFNREKSHHQRVVTSFGHTATAAAGNMLGLKEQLAAIRCMEVTAKKDLQLEQLQKEYEQRVTNTFRREAAAADSLAKIDSKLQNGLTGNPFAYGLPIFYVHYIPYFGESLCPKPPGGTHWALGTAVEAQKLTKNYNFGMTDRSVKLLSQSMNEGANGRAYLQKAEEEKFAGNNQKQLCKKALDSFANGARALATPVETADLQKLRERCEAKHIVAAQAYDTAMYNLDGWQTTLKTTKDLSLAALTIAATMTTGPAGATGVRLLAIQLGRAGLVGGTGALVYNTTDYGAKHYCAGHGGPPVESGAFGTACWGTLADAGNAMLWAVGNVGALRSIAWVGKGATRTSRCFKFLKPFQPVHYGLVMDLPANTTQTLWDMYAHPDEMPAALGGRIFLQRAVLGGACGLIGQLGAGLRSGASQAPGIFGKISRTTRSITSWGFEGTGIIASTHYFFANMSNARRNAALALGREALIDDERDAIDATIYSLLGFFGGKVSARQHRDAKNQQALVKHDLKSLLQSRLGYERARAGTNLLIEIEVESTAHSEPSRHENGRLNFRVNIGKDCGQHWEAASVAGAEAMARFVRANDAHTGGILENVVNDGVNRQTRQVIKHALGRTKAADGFETALVEEARAGRVPLPEAEQRPAARSTPVQRVDRILALLRRAQEQVRAAQGFAHGESAPDIAATKSSSLPVRMLKAVHRFLYTRTIGLPYRITCDLCAGAWRLLVRAWNLLPFDLARKSAAASAGIASQSPLPASLNPVAKFGEWLPFLKPVTNLCAGAPPMIWVWTVALIAGGTSMAVGTGRLVSRLVLRIVFDVSSPQTAGTALGKSITLRKLCADLENARGELGSSKTKLASEIESQISAIKQADEVVMRVFHNANSRITLPRAAAAGCKWLAQQIFSSSPAKPRLNDPLSICSQQLETLLRSLHGEAAHKTATFDELKLPGALRSQLREHIEKGRPPAEFLRDAAALRSFDRQLIDEIIWDLRSEAAAAFESVKQHEVAPLGVGRSNAAAAELAKLLRALQDPAKRNTALSELARQVEAGCSDDSVRRIASLVGRSANPATVREASALLARAKGTGEHAAAARAAIETLLFEQGASDPSTRCVEILKGQSFNELASAAANAVKGNAGSLKKFICAHRILELAHGRTGQRLLNLFELNGLLADSGALDQAMAASGGRSAADIAVERAVRAIQQEAALGAFGRVGNGRNNPPLSLPAKAAHTRFNDLLCVIDESLPPHARDRSLQEIQDVLNNTPGRRSRLAQEAEARAGGSTRLNAADSALQAIQQRLGRLLGLENRLQALLLDPSSSCADIVKAVAEMEGIISPARQTELLLHLANDFAVGNALGIVESLKSHTLPGEVQQMAILAGKKPGAAPKSLIKGLSPLLAGPIPNGEAAAAHVLRQLFSEALGNSAEAESCLRSLIRDPKAVPKELQRLVEDAAQTGDSRRREIAGAKLDRFAKKLMRARELFSLETATKRTELAKKHLPLFLAAASNPRPRPTLFDFLPAHEPLVLPAAASTPSSGGGLEFLESHACRHLRRGSLRDFARELAQSLDIRDLFSSDTLRKIFFEDLGKWRDLAPYIAVVPLQRIAQEWTKGQRDKLRNKPEAALPPRETGRKMEGMESSQQ